MANRHLARTIVLQTLFESDTHGFSLKKALEVLGRNIIEFAVDDMDRSFAERLLNGVFAKKDDIDMVIEKAAPSWSIDRIAPIDRNVLRLGLYELLFFDKKEVPPKVAINEAIELAKSFSGDSSGRFVNGVLGAVYRELGEPGKEDFSNKQVINKTLPTERLGGVLAYSKHEGQYYIVLVHDVFGYWTLPKGHIDEGLSVELGIKKIIKDDLNLDVKVEDKIGENEYIASSPEKGKVRKHVVFFLASTTFGNVSLKKSGGLDDVRWFRLKDIIDLNFYEDMLPIVTSAVQKLIDHANTNS